MAQLITPRGRVDIHPGNGVFFTLKEMYALLKCHTIEVVPTNDKQLLVIDEEARFDNTYINHEATREYLWGKFAYIRGPALKMTVREFGDNAIQ